MWIHEATIEVYGGYPFPLDMLRYDGCYPARQEDVSAIAGSFDYRLRRQQIETPASSAPLRVQVRRIDDLKARTFTVGRWESFGCKVTEIRSHKG